MVSCHGYSALQPTVDLCELENPTAQEALLLCSEATKALSAKELRAWAKIIKNTNKQIILGASMHEQTAHIDQIISLC